jgi:hypothetical protein
MQRFVRILSVSLGVLTLAAAGAAAQPVSEEPVNLLATTSSTSNQMNVAVFAVPAGRQLIIDYVSIRAQVPYGETVNSAFMNLPNVHYFVVSGQGTDLGNRSVFAAASSTRIVVGSGKTIVFRVERDGVGTTGFLSAAIAGRLVKE